MRGPYICPHCNHRSTRRWNLQIHIKRKHGEYLADRSLDVMANNPPLYSKSVQLGHPTITDSVVHTFHPTFLPQHMPLDVSPNFANPMNRLTADGQSFGTGLSWGTVQKIKELKGLMNKYSSYHTNPDDIIRFAIYNSINGDDTLLDGKLEQLRTIDSLAKY